MYVACLDVIPNINIKIKNYILYTKKNKQHLTKYEPGEKRCDLRLLR